MHYLLFLFTLSTLPFQEANPPISWFENIESAQEFAIQNDGQILMVFSGSDWCKPCIKFKQSILDDSEFKNFAEGKLAVLYLDFPAKKKNRLSDEQRIHNETLAEKYNRSGAFPTIILFDSEMHQIKELNYRGQKPEDFINEISH